MSFFYHNKEFFNDLDLAMCVISGKVKMPIIHALLNKAPLRLSELERCLPEVNQRILIRQLKELEEDKIVNRKEYKVVPPKVEYSLTDTGEALRPIMEPFCDWAHDYYDLRKDDAIKDEWEAPED